MMSVAASVIAGYVAAHLAVGLVFYIVHLKLDAYDREMALHKFSRLHEEL